MHAIFTGGYNPISNTNGTALSKAVGFGVFMKEVNATKQYTCSYQKDLKNMKRPRYCH
jgi:hypothetical protein